MFGFIDWLAIPSGTRAKAIGLWHGGGNFVIVVLFIISWLLRLANPGSPPAIAFVLALVGVAMALVTGWLGGELVYVHGVAVAEEPTAEFIERPSPLRRQVAH